MSQTRALESAIGPTATRRINFSDGNRALHVKALFTWLPEDLHDAPGIDWTQLPSVVIGYLVNTVGESTWTSSLALAAAVGRGPMRDHSLLDSISCLHRLLRSVQRLCGSKQASELTKSVWESYVTRKELTPGDYNNLKTYAMFTEGYFPDYLDQLDVRDRTRLKACTLPLLPRGFRKRHFPNSAKIEAEKQRRKGKSDVLAPLHSLLVALVRFRKQSTQRLLSAYHEALEQAKRGDIELPLPFSYEA
jgi:hypothetical protein